MATINLIEGLKLIRRFGDAPEVVSVIDKTIAELERLQDLDKQANILATAALENPGVIDRQAAWAVKKLVKVE